MTIIIDANEANVKNPVGSNIFVQEIIKNLQSIWSSSDPKVKLILSQPAQTGFFNQLDWPVEIVGPAFLWTQWRLPLYLYQTKPQVIFTPGHYAPRFKPASTKSIITIFDLAFLYFPDQFLAKDRWQLTSWTKYSVKNADHIITISKSSQNDIVKHYQVNKSKISVAYPGSRLSQAKVNGRDFSNLKSKYKIKLKKYILFVGTLQPRKNIVNLIEAFLEIKTDFKLVLVGRAGWLYQDQIKPILDKAVKTGRVIWLDFVNDDTLADFYRQAYFLILPSLWEGFGLPVVEANFYQTPAIVADNSSLKELIDNDDLKIKPPFDQVQINQVLAKMLKLDKKNYDKLSKVAYHQAQKFNWRQTAKTVKEQLLKLHQQA